MNKKNAIDRLKLLIATKDLTFDPRKLQDDLSKKHQKKVLMLKFYILEGDQVRATEDPIEYAEWKVKTTDHIALDRLNDGEVTVSTVFLGLDLGHGRSIEPVVFETATFTKNGGVIIDGRYTSLKDAQAGHASVVRKLKAKIRANDLEP